MTRRAALVLVVLALAPAACGRYGPPRRSVAPAPARPAPAAPGPAEPAQPPTEQESSPPP